MLHALAPQDCSLLPPVSGLTIELQGLFMEIPGRFPLAAEAEDHRHPAERFRGTSRVPQRLGSRGRRFQQNARRARFAKHESGASGDQQRPAGAAPIA